MKDAEIVQTCDRNNNETATLRKHVTKYKRMRKWMVEFLSKSDCRGIKIDRVYSIRITNLSIYFNFLRAIPLGDVIKMARFLISSPANQYYTLLHTVKNE